MMILLLPIVVFIVIYFQVSQAADAVQPWQTFIPFSAIVGTDLLFMFIFFNKKIKSIRNGQGLRLKLEKYFQLTIVRYSFGVISCLVLAYGFYITKDDIFTALFIFCLIVLGMLWPTAAKVCRDLRLRGDEREMVYFKKDAF